LAILPTKNTFVHQLDATGFSDLVASGFSSFTSDKTSSSGT
jgi:hypothetical protein